MIAKTITYTDYNGVERTETFRFNLTEQEIMEMQLSTVGGLAEMIQGIIDAQDYPAIIAIFKDLITRSYGVKSPDGRRFMKKDADGKPLVNEFIDTEAFSKLYMELATDDKAAAAFVNGITPNVENKGNLSVAPTR